MCYLIHSNNYLILPDVKVKRVDGRSYPYSPIEKEKVPSRLLVTGFLIFSLPLLAFPISIRCIGINLSPIGPTKPDLPRQALCVSASLRPPGRISFFFFIRAKPPRRKGKVFLSCFLSLVSYLQNSIRKHQ